MIYTVYIITRLTILDYIYINALYINNCKTYSTHYYVIFITPNILESYMSVQTMEPSKHPKWCIYTQIPIYEIIKFCVYSII